MSGTTTRRKFETKIDLNRTFLVSLGERKKRAFRFGEGRNARIYCTSFLSPALDGNEHRTLFVSSFRSSREIYLATVTFFPGLSFRARVSFIRLVLICQVK